MTDDHPGSDQATTAAVTPVSTRPASPATEPRTTSSAGTAARTAISRLGMWAWTFIGLVVTLVIMAAVLAAVNEIVLPLTFAAVLAVIFKPAAATLTGRRVKPAAAAGIVVLGLLALVTAVVVGTVQGIVGQLDQIGASVDAAATEADTSFGLDPATYEAVRTAVTSMSPSIEGGFLTTLVSGVGSLVGFASGVILGVLVMYYLLKDGTSMRRTLVSAIPAEARDDLDGFITDTCQVLRAYGRGRTVMSATVAAVIGVTSFLLDLPLVPTIMLANFIGGYIPYIGAFLGGGLAVIVALGDGGVPVATAMLVVVLAANLLLENFVEPKVMGSTLHIHPVVVLVVTALGGLIGGIVGLVLAVPATVIAGNALTRLRARGLVDQVVGRAEPVVRQALS